MFMVQVQPFRSENKPARVKFPQLDFDIFEIACVDNLDKKELFYEQTQKCKQYASKFNKQK
jgi:hypothetical protein